MPQLLNGLALSNTQFLWKSFTVRLLRKQKQLFPTPIPHSQKIKAKKN
jgi:hypothetical protein